MSKKLIITEKPSVAMDFARVLKVNGGERRNGYLENDEYVISWCYGHLVQMVYPEEYDIKYKSWRLEDLPFLPQDYKYGVVESAKEQYYIVNKLLHREDVDTVYWAGDSGKEGQTIEENIRMYGGVRDGMNELRVWIDSQTDDEMIRGITEAKPMSEYALLGRSGIMRTIEDYALGINFSRALSVKYGGMINDAAATTSYTAIAIGRVMTCVLGMVVDREREIRNFNQDPFFRVVGKFSEISFPAEWKAIEGSKYFESPVLYKENGFKELEGAEKLINELTSNQAVISNKEISTSKKRAPLLFNLAELQSECSKRFKISPAQTLEIIQDLYEKKFTTYPRTDARVLTTAVAKEITKNLNRLQGYAATSDFVKDILTNNRYIGLEKTSYTDDSKVTDHYAIIPTGQCNGVDSLPPLEKSVYDLIVRRFLSIFYPAAEYKNAKLTIKVGEESLFSSAKVLVEPGFLKIAGLPTQKESNDDEDDNEDTYSKEDFIKLVESLSINDEIENNGYEIKEGKTNPPKRYTSGNLILAMENAGKLIEDEELREQIKTTGIGTSATRGEIIDKLIRIGYLNLNNKTQIISPEKLGEMIYEVVLLSVPSLLSPKMTANWEKGLEGIVNGSVDDKEYRQKLEDYIRTETNKMIEYDLKNQIAININQFTGKDSKGIATRKPLGVNCPMCGGELTTTAFGYGCSNYFNEEIKCKFNLGQIAGVDLSEEEFKKLIIEGKTGIIEGFKGKHSKSKFSAIVELFKDDIGQYHTRFDFSQSKSDPIEGLVCPVCGKGIVSTSFGFCCENRFADNNKCNFSVGDIASRRLSLDELTSLLNNGETEILSGFKTKKNTPFNARLKLIKNEEGTTEITFDFEGVEAEKLGDCKCPDCGGDIFIRPSGYGCSNFDANNPNSCKFFISKTIASKSISPAQAQLLLNDGHTDTIRGFKGKTGNKFDAVLILKKNENNATEVTFDFDNVDVKKVEGVKCPDCGGEILVKSFGYGCSNYSSNNPDSCKFAIGKIANKSLTVKQVQSLFENGKTETIRDFKGKSGNKFDAVLVLKKNEEGKTEVTFDFEQVEQLVLEEVKCPACDGKIVITKFGYACENHFGDRENKCYFSINEVAGKKLSIDDVKELLLQGRTKTIRGFKSKTKKSFDACLKLEHDEEGKVVVNFDFDNVEAKVVDDVKCPVCGGAIVVTPFGYGCSNYNKDDQENSCKFNIGQVAGVKLKEAQVKELLKNGITSLITGFKSKKGDKFDAKLSLGKDELGNVTGIKFVFENHETVLEKVKCPKCGAPIIKDHFGYRCQNNIQDNADSCTFYVGKIAGISLETEQFEKLILERKTDLISGFLSKKGLFFDARLKLDEENKVVFEFEQFG